MSQKLVRNKQILVTLSDDLFYVEQAGSAQGLTLLKYIFKC